MKKTYLIYILLIVFALSFIIYYGKIQPELHSPESVLSKAFNESGAKPVNAEVYFWGKLNDKKNSNIDELKELVVSISNELGLNKGSDLSTTAVKNDLIQEIQLKGIMDGNRIAAINAQLNKVRDGKDERYISVTVTEDMSNIDLERTKKEVMRVLKEFDINAKVSSCLTGSYNGKLNKNQMNNICRKVFKEASARKVEGIKDGNLISVSAYSPSINNYIKVEENRVNLNIALRYNSYEDKTYIWLATPVITTEY